MRILLVEDNPRVRLLLTEAIERDTQHKVVASADEAGTALRRIGQLMPDLVIADLDLSNGTGFQVLAATKVYPDGPRIIAISNSGDDIHRRRALESGAHYFFDKSLEFDAMLALLQSLPAAGAKATRSATRFGVGE